MAHAEDGWCVALDRTRMNCGIYENRPAVCRRFFMGGPYCRAIRSDYAKQEKEQATRDNVAPGDTRRDPPEGLS